MNCQWMKAPDELHPVRTLDPVGWKKRQQRRQDQDGQQQNQADTKFLQDPTARRCHEQRLPSATAWLKMEQRLTPRFPSQRALASRWSISVPGPEKNN